MPGSERSLAITDAYRRRLLTLRTRGAQAITFDWVAVMDGRDLDTSHAAWARAAAATIATLQTAGVRLTAAYLTAFLRSELGQPVSAPAIDERAHVGVARTGKPLAEALTTTLITVKNAIAHGEHVNTALGRGSTQASRLASSESMAAARGALLEGIRTDERIVGWRRVTSGGCGACLAAATRTYADHEPLRVHDDCRCGAEPIIRDIPDRAPRADGHQIFDAMNVAQQNAALGHTTAQLVRAGDVPLSDLIEINHMAAITDVITQAPIQALT